MVSTTPVTTLEGAIVSFTQVSKREFGSIWIHSTQLMKPRFTSLAPSMRTTFSYSGLKAQFPINFHIQMESNQDSVALAQQVQALATIELTRQNKEMKLWLQQEENRFRANQEDKGDSLKRSDGQGPTTPEEPHLDSLSEMRKQMDELRKAIKGQTNRNLDKMVRTIDSLFTMAVLECPVPSKF